ncbi:Protein INVOLVED IN DE NOVO 2 [Glycine max]|nr:Protein INVOLVED IN DE NOVO 2 [Glycine max]
MPCVWENEISSFPQDMLQNVNKVRALVSIRQKRCIVGSLDSWKGLVSSLSCEGIVANSTFGLCLVHCIPSLSTASRKLQPSPTKIDLNGYIAVLVFWPYVRWTRTRSAVHNRPGKVVNDGSRNIYNDKFGIVVNDRPENVVIVNDRSEKVAKNQLFVWPWMGIVANIATEFKGGRCIGNIGSKLRDEFTLKGFHPLKVQSLWNRYGHSGFSIVEFSKD